MANCLIKNFSIMYQFKQDLAMAYFPDHSKESASKRPSRWMFLFWFVVSDLQSDTYYFKDL